MKKDIPTAARIAGFAVTPLFALYNGALGILRGSVWHGSICVYYLLLSALRGILLRAERKDRLAAQSGAGERGWLPRLTSAMLLLLNMALVAPVSLMVLDARPVRLGLVPAIACAAYTTYKVTASCVKLKRRKTGVFARQLDRVGFVDALVSILVLQNTLLTTMNGTVTQEMLPVAAGSSAIILLIIFLLSVFWLAGGKSQENPCP